MTKYWCEKCKKWSCTVEFPKDSGDYYCEICEKPTGSLKMTDENRIKPELIKILGALTEREDMVMQQTIRLMKKVKK